jgi:putative heme-binding domain-containing protein
MNRLLTTPVWLVFFTLAAAVPATAHAQGTTAALRRLLESGRVPAERQAMIVERIVAGGDADDLAFVFAMLDEPEGLPAELRRQVVEWLTQAAVQRKVKPEGDLSPLAKLIEGDADDPRLQVAAIRLAAAWELTEVAPTLRRLATDERASEGLQQAALDGLVAISGAENQETIEQVARSGRSPRIRGLAVAALARIDVAAAAESAAQVLAVAKEIQDVGPMLDSLLGRREGADKLAASLEKRRPPPDAAKLALRYVYSVGRSDAALSNVLSEAAGIALDAPPPSQEEVARLVAEVVAKGDAARGERVFRRAELSCLKCHSVAGAGGTVGPDLSPIGSTSPVEYIVNSILDPDQAIKEQFVTRRVLTLDGEVFTGIQVDRDDEVLRLRDASGKLVVIPTDNIDQEGEGKSLMPQGLTKFLTKQEFLDLARFVSELGKPGPYAIRQTPSIQRWRVLKEPGHELVAEVPNVEILREQVLAAPPEAWLPAYGMVGGALPLAELAVQRPAVLYLQGEIDVIEPGEVTIAIASTEALHVWLDAEPFEGAHQIARELAAGRHTITLRVDVSDHAFPEVKVEILKPAGSAAQFVVVGGS